MYVSKKSLDRPDVLAFTKFYIEKAVELVPEVGYVPLSEKAYQLCGQRIDKRLTGSMFAGGGSQVGVSLEKLMESGK